MSGIPTSALLFSTILWTCSLLTAQPECSLFPLRKMYSDRFHCSMLQCSTISFQQNLDSSKLKEFADNNFNFDENG